MRSGTVRNGVVKFFYGHGSTDSKGVMIMIKKKAPVRLGKTKSCMEGRMVMCEVFYEFLHFCLVNIYAPNNDDVNFFVECFSEIARFEDEVGSSEKIIVGDLNLVMDLEKDKIGGRKQTHTKSANVLHAYMLEENLDDIWRLMYPESKEMTWKITNPIPILERLDYILTSNGISGMVKASGISPSFLSDHSIPWVVISPHKTEQGRGFWKLNVTLLSDKEYDSMIKELIQDIMKEPMQNVAKWEWLKHKIRESTIRFSSQKNKSKVNKLLLFEKKLTEYNKKLVEMCEENNSSDANISNSSDPTSNCDKFDIMTIREIEKQIKRIEREREELIEEKVRGSMLRARRDWTVYGERPSKYYLGLETRNYKRKNRFSIKDKTGQLISGVRNVLKEQFKFYEDLYSTRDFQFKPGLYDKFVSNLTCPKIKDEDVLMLESDISELELRKAVFGMKRDKVPGSDGLSIEFYQKYFGLLKNLMLSICKSAAKNGLHTTAKQGIIALIEKSGKNLDYLTNWHPLSLLNCDGKVYAKILSLRLEKVTSYLLHTDQFGFQQGRSIQDNLMDLISTIDYANFRQKRMLIVSFDFAKAFDRIDWGYLDNVLCSFGFGTTFRKMVESAHKDTTCCTINAGFSSRYMKIERGL